MHDYDYHSLFYFGILAKLQGYVGKDGKPIKPSRDDEDKKYEVWIGYEPRQDRFNHFYQRDKFVAERDRLVVMSKVGENSNAVVIMRVGRFEDKAVIYKKALRYMFKANYAVARRELTLLMEKFYDLEVEEQSGFIKVDFSDIPDNSNHSYVDRPLQKKATQTITLQPRSVRNIFGV